MSHHLLPYGALELIHLLILLIDPRPFRGRGCFSEEKVARLHNHFVRYLQHALEVFAHGTKWIVGS
jgi:hypothetical protein